MPRVPAFEYALRVGARWVACLATLAGCFSEPPGVWCSNGAESWVCPATTTCGVPSGCIRPGDCGDGVIDENELCDDGNRAGGDGCSADCSSDETCGNGVVDADTTEECDDANAASHDGCSSGCLEEHLTWHEKTGGPAPRQYAAAVWDPDRGRGVMYGGKQIMTESANAETWYFASGAWTLGPDGLVAVAGHAMATDGRGAIVTYGGERPSGDQSNIDTSCRNCGLLGETAWSACPSTPTTGRFLHGMATARGGKILMFGGVTQNANHPITWEANAFSLPMPGPAAPRWSASVVYDPVTQRTYVIGGSGGSVIAETWAWDGSAWSYSYSGLPRVSPRVVYDPVRRRFVGFGGVDFQSMRPATIEEWDGEDDWASVDVPGGPSGRSAHVAFFDPIAHAMVVFGGHDGTSVVGDTWMLRMESATPDDACDGEDADGDGARGCDDPDCWARCQPHCPPGSTCDAAAPTCGDGVCNAYLETPALCPADC